MLPDRYKDKFRITKLETFKIQKRYLFLRIHTDHASPSKPSMSIFVFG